MTHIPHGASTLGYTATFYNWLDYRVLHLDIFACKCGLFKLSHKNILQRSWLGCPAKKLAGMSMPAFTLFTPSASVAGHMKILHSGSNSKSGLSIPVATTQMRFAVMFSAVKRKTEHERGKEKTNNLLVGLMSHSCISHPLTSLKCYFAVCLHYNLTSFESYFAICLQYNLKL